MMTSYYIVVFMEITYIPHFHIDTYEVQEVSIVPEDISTGYFSINCTFLTGSQVKGCAIDVVNNDTGEYIFNQNISRLQSTSLYAIANTTKSLTVNGTYIVHVYIWDEYGGIDTSLVVASKLVNVALSYQENNNMSNINCKWYSSKCYCIFYYRY